MSKELAVAITRLSEILERFYPLFQRQIESNQSSRDSEEGEDRAKAAGKEVATGTTAATSLGSSTFGILSSMAGTVSQVYMPSFAQIEGGREMTQGIKAPVERAYQEIDAFSKKGIILQQEQLETIAEATASQQQAAQSNMKMFRPMVGEGIKGNIVSKLGEMYTDWEDDVANRGVFKATGGPSDVASGAVDLWKKGAQAIYGVDVFGR